MSRTRGTRPTKGTKNKFVSQRAIPAGVAIDTEGIPQIDTNGTYELDTE